MKITVFVLLLPLLLQAQDSGDCRLKQPLFDWCSPSVDSCVRYLFSWERKQLECLKSNLEYPPPEPMYWYVTYFHLKHKIENFQRINKCELGYEYLKDHFDLRSVLDTISPDFLARLDSFWVEDMSKNKHLRVIATKNYLPQGIERLHHVTAVNFYVFLWGIPSIYASTYDAEFKKQLRLCGPLPSGLWKMPALKSLNLTHFHLSDSIRNLVNLEHLAFHTDSLCVEKLPSCESLAALTRLKYLYLESSSSYSVGPVIERIGCLSDSLELIMSLPHMNGKHFFRDVLSKFSDKKFKEMDFRVGFNEEMLRYDIDYYYCLGYNEEPLEGYALRIEDSSFNFDFKGTESLSLWVDGADTLVLSRHSFKDLKRLFFRGGASNYIIIDNPQKSKIESISMPYHTDKKYPSWVHKLFKLTTPAYVHQWQFDILCRMPHLQELRGIPTYLDYTNLEGSMPNIRRLYFSDCNREDRREEQMQHIKRLFPNAEFLVEDL